MWKNVNLVLCILHWSIYKLTVSKFAAILELKTSCFIQYSSLKRHTLLWLFAYLNTKLSRRARLSLDPAFVFATKLPPLSVFFPNQEVLKCLVVRIRNPGNSCLWNPGSRVLESEIQLKDNGIPLTIGIRNPRSTNNESRIQYLKSEIPSVGSRIEGCLPFTQTTRVELLRLRVFPIFPQG